MSEMLALPNLPDDLRKAITEHLNQQLSLVNVLKPEYCRRLYPILAELADLTNGSETSDHGAGKGNELPEQIKQGVESDYAETVEVR
jgi:hypothetical protein